MKEIHFVKYQCDFCEEISLNVDTIVNHEQKCHGNPINQKCPSCSYFNVSWADHEIETWCQKEHNPFSVMWRNITCKDWNIKDETI